MKEYKGEIKINKNIEECFNFFDGSEENLKKMDSKIVSNKIIKETKEKIGSISLQVYKEGKREMQYEVVTTKYIDQEKYKELGIFFNLGKMFEINATHTLEYISETETKLTYEVSNKPVKWYTKVMLIFSGNGSSVVENHLTHVKEVIENK